MFTIVERQKGLWGVHDSDDDSIEFCSEKEIAKAIAAGINVRGVRKDSSGHLCFFVYKGSILDRLKKEGKEKEE